MVHKIFILLLALCLIFSASSVEAKTSLKSKQQVLGKVELKKMAQHLVKDLIDDSFFQSPELPPRTVLSAISLKGTDLGTTQEEFTNLVLNRLIDQPKVIVANQDFSTDIAADYKLMFYLPEQETREKGVLLGADYALSGTLESQEMMNDKGKVSRFFVATLFVKDIRTNKLITKAVYDSTDHKK